jgi:hypothetical protein
MRDKGAPDIVVAALAGAQGGVVAARQLTASA